ncbi:NucA/NucB deoxyribonuclease domain-containing protein, partial [Streptomyces roseolilacinus]|uniref:NucA/NucB deoxyribonuclease domain-containing protein n=1 Tax=Streptomyces roseolilacinus TaxID=66904 RepID=UPI00227D7E07
AKVSQTGAVPGPRSFDALATQQSKGFTRVLNAAPGQGSKPDDAVFSVFEASATVTPPPGYKPTGELSGKLFFLPPRWDNAKYLKVPQGAAVFSYSIPLVYNTKAGAPEKAVADHIKAAFTQPGSTKPANANKNVPGQSASAPLHRLYHDNARRKKNRATAVSTCKKEFGANYAQGGKECDEYPFAVTYEGCALPSYDQAAPKNNFSVRALPKADNGNAGNLLGQFLTLNRIIDGKDDGFYVTIT